MLLIEILGAFFMIISLCGLIGSGKDTVASDLINLAKFKKFSFAGSLKNTASAIFSWDRDLLEGATEESRVWRETVDEWWANKLGIPNLTPRWVLQYLGTDVLRTHFHEDIWLASLEKQLENAKIWTRNIIVTDCRFKNELELLSGMGAHMIRVKRGDDPEWFHIAESVFNNDDEQSRLDLAQRKIHPSEYSWCGYNFQHTIMNDGTLSELYRKSRDLIDTFE